MSKQGWIKLHRKFTEWEWYTDLPVKILFIHLLLKANHDFEIWRGEHIHRGQVVAGRKKLALETGLSEQQIRTALSKLKRTGEVKIAKATNKFTILSICNYKDYQKKEKASNQQNNQQITNHQPTNNHKQEVKKLRSQESSSTRDDDNYSSELDYQESAESVDLKSQTIDKEITQVWNSFAEKKSNGSEMFIVEKAVRQILNETDITFEQIKQAIENYRQARKLKNSQAGRFRLPKFLDGFLDGKRKNYLPGYFDIDDFDGARFKNGDKKESAAERAKRLDVEKGRVNVK